MSDVQQQIDRWVARQPAARLLVGGASGLGGGLLASLALVDPLLDLLVIGLGVTVGLGAGLAIWRRNALFSLPLRLAPTLVTGTLDGRPAFWTRACLGQGRLLRDVVVQVAFVDAQGAEHPLEPLVPELPSLLGPLTVAVVDRAATVGAEGALQVRVRGTEGDTVHEVSQRFALDGAVPGRFAPAWERVGRRWEPDLSHWQGLTPGDDP